MSTLEALREALPKLGSDRPFAESLVRNAGTYGGFTPKMEACALRLIRQATTTPVKLDVSGVVELMNRGGKRVKIDLTREIDDDHTRFTIRLSQTTTGVEPGSIVVVSPDGGYGCGKFYGRVSRDGTYKPGRDSTPELEPVIVGLLQDLANDPEGTAAAHGKLTGSCCFCRLPLTDVRSRHVGYGKRCAEKFLLPWGGELA